MSGMFIGLDKDQAKLFLTELRRLHLPIPLVGFGMSMIGPTLLQFGTEDQKREHLPRIVRGEIRWAQGYSEPTPAATSRRSRPRHASPATS